MQNMFHSLNISSSGLQAERLRMQTVAENLANINTTRQNGEKTPYQRKEVVFDELLSEEGFTGVTANVELDESDPIKVFQPNHPDADENGYLHKPNIDNHFEMVDLLSSSRAYRANLVAVNITKDLIQRTINVGRS